jgi:hypothetical protein
VAGDASAGSAFDVLSRRLGELVDGLPRRSQVLFYAAAAEALLGDGAAPLADALAAARDFSIYGDLPDRTDDLLEAIAALPDGAADGDVIVHDGLICAEIALRIIRGDFDAKDGMWYVLEPQLQSVSERLFGFTDVGSERAPRDEPIALRHDDLVRLVSVIEAVLQRLHAEPLVDADAAFVRASLRHARP